MKHFFLIFTLLFLTACSNNQVVKSKEISPQEENTNNSSSTSEETDDQNEKPEITVDEDIDYSKFFMPNGSTAYFLGEGNEYATYTVHTKWLSNRYVALVEDNGGAAMLKIYRVMGEYDKIDKVYEEMIEGLPSEVQYPSAEELNSHPLIEPYLKGPLEVGTIIGNWKIVDVDTTLETPYKTFQHVFVLEEESSENFINRKYFALGYGEIKRESIMQTEDEENFVVTSTLEKIETVK